MIRFTRPVAAALLAGMPMFSVGCASLHKKPMPAISQAAPAAADSRLEAARRAEQAGNFHQAHQLYAALSRENPRSVEYLHRLAILETRLGNFSAANNYFAQAISLAPKDAKLLSDAGYACYLRGELHQAEGYLERAMALQNPSPRAINNLALVYGYQGRTDEALVLFRKVNSEAEALASIANIHRQRGEKELAAIRYREVLALDASHEQALKVLGELDIRTEVATSDELAPSGLNLDQPTEASLPATTPIREFVIEEFVDNSVTTEVVAQNETNEATPLILPDDSEELSDVSPTDTTVAAGDVDDNSGWQDESSPVIQVAESNQSITAVELPPEEQALELGDAAFFEAPSAEPLAMAAEPAATAAQGEEQVIEFVTTDEQADNVSLLEDAPGADVEVELAEAVAMTAPAALAAPATSAAAVHGSSAAVPVSPVSREQLPLGIGGYCPVTMRDSHELASGSPEWELEFHGMRYRFASSTAQQDFQADPDRYIPAAGGLDVVAVREGQGVVCGSLEHATWFRDKLYLFASADSLTTFRSNAKQFARGY